LIWEALIGLSAPIGAFVVLHTVLDSEESLIHKLDGSGYAASESEQDVRCKRIMRIGSSWLNLAQGL
jgi:hypothetical protein